MNKKRPKRSEPAPVGPAHRAGPLGPADSFGRELANWLFPLYLAAILAALLAIRMWGMNAGASNGVRALFAALNAATLTGFAQNPGLGALNIAGQWVVLLLIIAGSLFNMIVGGMAVRRIARLRFSDAQVFAAALGVECAALLIGGVALSDPDRPAFQSLFLAASAFGNCGLYPANLPYASDALTHLVILPLSILGGLGLPVLMELPGAIFFKKPFSTHSRTVLTTSAWLYVIGLILLFALSLPGHHIFTADGAHLIAQSSVLSIQSRTGGLAIVSVTDASPAAQWILIILMAIGASSASTGGGLKTTTLAELVRGVYRLLHGLPVSRSLGIALAWLGIYLAMIFGASILLTHLDFAGGADNVIFNAVSGISNVGLSRAEIPDEAGLMYGYCAIMLLGRMVPLLILWWMADTTTDADVAIG